MLLKMNKDNIVNIDNVDIVQDIRMNLDENKKEARFKCSLMDKDGNPNPVDFYLHYTKPKVSLKGGNISITGTEMTKNKNISIDATVGMSGNPNIVATYDGITKTINSFKDLRDLILDN